MSGTVPVGLGDAPPFREPWQAKAFALAVLLHREGHFTWDAWVRTLAEEIAAFPQRAGEDAELAYHRQFLAALETIVANTGLAKPEAMQARKMAWRQAYLNTPHGHAVDLAAAGEPHVDEARDHDLEPQRAPIAISPARGAG
ncbi:nitrile hydratase accessory protein [Rhodopila globiformis]|uniref:nitrile hydratase accessory protein n=1 Tax=Rhodopila globiformis TaxID=1071 RepID=UPI001304A975|nr:nitrile hydratase accessory protein [Rhodopila globiformis]